VHPAITGKSRFTLLTDLAIRMRSLGRIQSALSALEKALEDFEDERMSEGYDAVMATVQLAELQLISGNIYAAIHSAGRAIRYADHPDQHRTYFKFHARTSLADALMQQGKLEEAGRWFEEAKRIAEADPNSSPEFLYSQTCYRYGLFLIESGREDELIELAKNTRHWGDQRPHRRKPNGTDSKLGSLLSAAIDQMILAEALVRQNEKHNHNPAEARDVIEGSNGAIALLMQSGYSDYLARGLNIAARYHTTQREFDEAQNRLEQNQDHVERGGMRLLKVDYLCELCRFHIMQSSWDQADESCDRAQQLANEIGYGRRKQELQQFRLAITRKQPEAAMHRTT
jgi:tetratricopeptide (TPR) repeat protein